MQEKLTFKLSQLIALQSYFQSPCHYLPIHKYAALHLFQPHH